MSVLSDIAGAFRRGMGSHVFDWQIGQAVGGCGTATP